MATTPETTPAATVESVVKADAVAVESKVVAFVKKYGPYAAGLVVGAIIGHFA